MAQLWLILTNPYAYEKAVERAVTLAQKNNLQIRVVFLITQQWLDKTVSELSETGWLSSASLRSLEISMQEGYRALAADVLEEVERQTKTNQVEVIVEGVVEAPSLEQYLNLAIKQGGEQLIIGSPQQTTKLKRSPSSLEWID
ncbi:MAG: hypothetical protein SAJ37_00985 [Oscillatoria sp. PMC 1068.18]|nr:hypothetical protein [Oscillatoria sp. PMC 1076.18]MEC4987296.1 hypothetical protein [Oscillatoria sp. PMC 1068.18]